jgi:ribosomal protein S18 acetylase RimI-like enzyme
MEIEIRTPQTEKEWESYYDLRYRILRQPWNQPQGSEKNEGDASAVHICLYFNGITKAISRLDESGAGVGQIRFMAVDTQEQGKGWGRLVMNYAEKQAVELGYSKMILHARENAVSFYEKLGYSLVAPSHLLFGEIQHFLMEKELKNE